jgi:membrane protease YdiL (CAAX protease family)
LVSKVLIVVALVLSLCITLLALRRALLVLVILVTPVIIIALGRFVPGAEGRDYRQRTLTTFGILGSVALVAVIVATFSGHLKPLNLFNEVAGGFDFGGSSPDAAVRGREFHSLLEGWLHSPIIGSGFGAVASFVRSPSQPWAYELSYNALLFQAGIIGGLLYLAGVAWIFWQCLEVTQRSPLSVSMRPVIVGSICFLLANATNPYLAKFDYLWILFLPLAYVNFWRLSTAATSISLDWNNRDAHMLLIKMGRLIPERDPDEG